MRLLVILVYGLGCSLMMGSGQSPTQPPTAAPTFNPTAVPTGTPTAEGTPWPTPYPTRVEDFNDPTGQPSRQPTGQPTTQPSGQPTQAPSKSGTPTFGPTPRPTAVAPPTFEPTPQPTPPTLWIPTPNPTQAPSEEPSNRPSTQPSGQPTTAPTISQHPTPNPTFVPTGVPSGQPTTQPSLMPSGQPTADPSAGPTEAPTLSAPPTEFMPSGQPTGVPTGQPTTAPSISSNPTKIPSGQPSGQPSTQPTDQPTTQPSGQPTSQPSVPTGKPSGQPSGKPSAAPSKRTTPTFGPTPYPTIGPTPVPSAPTMDPTTGQPARPSSEPTGEPSREPTGQPTSSPTRVSLDPTGQPTSVPSGQPTCRPSPFGGRDEWYTSQPSPLYSQDSVTGTVNFDPTDVGVCEDMEIQIQFDPSLRMNQYGAYRINMPGITIGDCNNASHELSGHSDGMGVKLLASWPYDVRFFEGKTHNTFLGSYIIAQYVLPGQLPVPGPTQKLYLDRSNGLKRTCPGSAQNATWNVFRYIQSPLFNETTQPYPTAAPTAEATGWVPTPNPTAFVPGITADTDTLYPTSSPTGLININVPDDHDGKYKSGYVGYLTEQNNHLENMCFVYTSSLEFWPAFHHADVTVNLTLTLGQTLAVGDTIDVYLPGFTNRFGHYPLNPGLVYNATSHEDSPSSFEEQAASSALRNITGGPLPQVGDYWDIGAWTGYWYEGNNASDYQDSKLRVTAGREFPAGQQFSIVIDRCPNALVAVFGREPNYAGFHFKVLGSTYYTNKTVPDAVDAIGDGCRALNYCNDQGKCDHKTSTCTCFGGYGSWYDKLKAVSDDFLPDCTSRSCPVGPAVGSLPKDRSTGLHREVECSNVGICNRGTGACECPVGFEGDNCGKRTCPKGSNGQICSGRGRCKSMHRLASDTAATPLTSSTTATYTTANLNGTKASWDADMGYACVCDSSWAVGLDAHETQLAEFFGPACQLRRCPGGDDPATPTINETDCSGKSQTGGSTTGSAFNLCHIDCSNHGRCSFTTGTCDCHDGWYGSNCGNKRTQVGPGTRERLVTEL